MKITIRVRGREEQFVWSDVLPVNMAALEAARHFGLTGENVQEARFHGRTPAPWTFASPYGVRPSGPFETVRGFAFQHGPVLELIDLRIPTT